jgi:hypothetical protein
LARSSPARQGGREPSGQVAARTRASLRACMGRGGGRARTFGVTTGAEEAVRRHRWRCGRPWRRASVDSILHVLAVSRPRSPPRGLRPPGHPVLARF